MLCCAVYLPLSSLTGTVLMLWLAEKGWGWKSQPWTTVRICRGWGAASHRLFPHSLQEWKGRGAWPDPRLGHQNEAGGQGFKPPPLPAWEPLWGLPGWGRRALAWLFPVCHWSGGGRGHGQTPSLGRRAEAEGRESRDSSWGLPGGSSPCQAFAPLPPHNVPEPGAGRLRRGERGLTSHPWPHRTPAGGGGGGSPCQSPKGATCSSKEQGCGQAPWGSHMKLEGGGFKPLPLPQILVRVCLGRQPLPGFYPLLAPWLSGRAWPCPSLGPAG